MKGTNDWLVFEVPAPPSTNALYINPSGPQIRYRNGKRVTPGRIKTIAYKNWQELASLRVKEQIKPLPSCKGEVLACIDLPPGLDLDNVKAIADLLQEKTGLGIIANDKLIVDYRVRRVLAGAPCIVRVRPATGEWWS